MHVKMPGSRLVLLFPRRPTLPAPLLPWTQVAVRLCWQNCYEDKRTQASWANWFWPTPPMEFICFSLHICHCWSVFLSFPSCSCTNIQITKPPHWLRLYKEGFPSPGFACAMLNLRATRNTDSPHAYSSTWLWHTILPAEFKWPYHMQVHNPFRQNIFSPQHKQATVLSVLLASKHMKWDARSLFDYYWNPTINVQFSNILLIFQAIIISASQSIQSHTLSVSV